MKKAISILLTLGMTLSLAACGGADTTTGTTGTETKTSNKTGDTITMAIWDNNQLAGIQKIADLAGDDLTALMDRLDAVTEADKDYTVFDGWEKDTDGSVKFVIETAAIK